MELSKGAHAPVPTSLLAVSFSWRSDHAVDAHALLVTTSGLVRTDRDFVFFNAPRHASQAVTLDQQPEPGTARLSVSLPRTELEIDRIVVSGSLDTGTFADLPDLTLTISAADGPIIEFPVTAIEPVQAMMFGEFYRRDGAWRFRAIGQGWTGGLAGLATEFGVIVDEPRTPSGTTRDHAHGARPVGPRSLPPRYSSPASARVGSTLATNTPTGTGNATTAHASASPNSATTYTPTGTGNVATAHATASQNSAASNAREFHDRDESANTAAARNGQARPERAWPQSRDQSPTRPTSLTRRVIDVPPPPPEHPEVANWHPDPDGGPNLRWWDGDEWTTATTQPLEQRPHHCPRCGTALRRKLFRGHAPCAACEAERQELLDPWHNRARRILHNQGTTSPEWQHLWATLRFHRIDAAHGRELLRDAGYLQIERMVAFAFADGEVSADELDAFEHVVAELALGGPVVDDLRRRMHRGRLLSRLRAGELPTVDSPGLHLDPDERVHLDVAAVHVRMLARGPKHTEGRMIASSKKLRYVGEGAGLEFPWARIVSIHAEPGVVVISATSARGGATFGVPDPDYVAAALEGALRVAKRLVLTPGQLDSRSISQDVKAQVWQRDGGRCVECGDGHYLEFDHVIPLSRGGATSAANLQILCRACNRAKGARI
ncbi:TerD family protein [Nocardia camponoti]|uniref:HNH nuclease domain-containing protein n=1 Tax=Nocardia camponoti TaxID=1616106 RepID=A0A917QQD6_9NOCA|nr:TerD family protein [Nocardia camponoti]GGK62017.1 hypothetical protein GCM10011591_37820 [Nocardia camponoti]